MDGASYLVSQARLGRRSKTSDDLVINRQGVFADQVGPADQSLGYQLLNLEIVGVPAQQCLTQFDGLFPGLKFFRRSIRQFGPGETERFRQFLALIVVAAVADGDGEGDRLAVLGAPHRVSHGFQGSL